MVLMTAACTKGKAQELKSFVTDLCFLNGCEAKRLPIRRGCWIYPLSSRLSS